MDAAYNVLICPPSVGSPHRPSCSLCVCRVCLCVCVDCACHGGAVTVSVPLLHTRPLSGRPRERGERPLLESLRRTAGLGRRRPQGQTLERPRRSVLLYIYIYIYIYIYTYIHITQLGSHGSGNGQWAQSTDSASLQGQSTNHLWRPLLIPSLSSLLTHSLVCSLIHSSRHYRICSRK